jgi:hypothetical protein
MFYNPVHKSGKAQWRLANRCYDAEWFRDAVEKKIINLAFQTANPAPCPSNTRRTDTSIATASRLCSAASTTDVRVAIRYDRSGTVFFSALADGAPLSSGCDQRVLSLERASCISFNAARSSHQHRN